MEPKLPLIFPLTSRVCQTAQQIPGRFDRVVVDGWRADQHAIAGLDAIEVFMDIDFADVIELHFDTRFARPFGNFFRHGRRVAVSADVIDQQSLWIVDRDLR